MSNVAVGGGEERIHFKMSPELFHPHILPTPSFFGILNLLMFIACSMYTVRTECAVLQSPLVASVRYERALPPTRKVADFVRSAEERVYTDNT